MDGVNIFSSIEFDEKAKFHLNEVKNWCNELDFSKLARPQNVGNRTIPLTFYLPFVEDNLKKENNIFGEDQIIQCNENVVIEGNLGSGKTTTLKRLVSHFFCSDDPNVSSFKYPILVRCRDIEPPFDLYMYLCHVLSIPYDESARDVEIKVTQSEDVLYGVDQKTKKVFFNHIGGIDLSIFLSRLLDENKVLLVFDGLDETKPELSEKVLKQVKEMSLKFTKAKFIATARPNYIKIALANTNTFQIDALADDQIRDISSRWIANTEDFIAQLRSRPYFELANKPLFLIVLILLYLESDSMAGNLLPPTSKEVYDDILELLVTRWDKERGVRRLSKYSNFSIKRKIEFLSHLSFKLTYQIKQRVFTRELLATAYEAICEKYKLPVSESSQVAEEIESHTGLISKRTKGKLEFSHLVFQEFLCANHIIKGPFDSVIKDYLREYPPPLAVAVGLSSEPSRWLYGLVLLIIGLESAPTFAFEQLLNRLCAESPSLEKSKYLGMAVLLISKHSDCSDRAFQLSMEAFLDSDSNCIHSIREVLENYTYISSNNSKAMYRYIEDPETFRDTFYPDIVVFPENLSYYFNK